MHREPDWEALDQLQFLLMRRIVEPLNAALAAVSLVHLESAADKPRSYWQERATGEVLGVLNLVNAWHALIRFKLGELLPQQHIQPFYVQDLLDWLTYHLQHGAPLRAEQNLAIEANRGSLQEALLLLNSAVYTLGPSVNLLVESTGNGVWFRVRYARLGKPCHTSLESLLETLEGNWRLQDTAFELRTAADFIALNGSVLHLQGTEHFCEMAFFIYAVGKRPPEPLKTPQVTQPPPLEETGAEEILNAFVTVSSGDDATRPLPESAAAQEQEQGARPAEDEPSSPQAAEDSAPADPDPDHRPPAPPGPESDRPPRAALQAPDAGSPPDPETLTGDASPAGAAPGDEAAAQGEGGAPPDVDQTADAPVTLAADGAEDQASGGDRPAPPPPPEDSTGQDAPTAEPPLQTAESPPQATGS